MLAWLAMLGHPRIFAGLPALLFVLACGSSAPPPPEPPSIVSSTCSVECADREDVLEASVTCQPGYEAVCRCDDETGRVAYCVSEGE